MAESVFPCYPPSKLRIPLKKWKTLAILHICLLRFFFIIPSESWMMVDFVGKSSKKNTIWFLWRFYFVKRMWLIPVLYFYARGEKIMIPAIFNSLIEGIFITKWLSKFHKEVFCFTELSLFADVTDGSCCRLIPNNYYYSLMYGTWNWLCTWDEEE